MKLAALTVPAEMTHIRTARLVAAAIASQAGLDPETVEDVRLAVGEAFVLSTRQAIGHASSPANLELEFDLAADNTLCVRVQPCVLDESLATLVVQAVVPRVTEDSSGLEMWWPGAGTTSSRQPVH